MIVEETTVRRYAVCDRCGKEGGGERPLGWVVFSPAWAGTMPWTNGCYNVVACARCRTDCQRCDGTGTVLKVRLTANDDGTTERNGVSFLDCPQCVDSA